ncbi:hypothetical protein PHLH4_42380 [Pseudomonas sp. St316]|nr:hypothetical protein PHLH4_42380 [Pseudomonas sp. St316]
MRQASLEKHGRSVICISVLPKYLEASLRLDGFPGRA